MTTIRATASDMGFREKIRLINVVIILNMVLAILLLVYIFHDVSRAGIMNYTEGGNKAELNSWWPIAVMFAMMAFGIVTIQLTMDLILIKNLPFLEKSIETSEHWLKLTTGFEVLQILGFLLTLFHQNNSDGGIPHFLMPVIVLSGILVRAISLYLVNSHLVILKAQAPSGLDHRDMYFISLGPEFYRSQSELSESSIARCDV